MLHDLESAAILRSRMGSLLCRTFDVGGLRRFIKGLPSGDILGSELPGESAGLAEFVDAFVEVGLHHGIFDDEFFRLLGDKRPRWQREIESIRAEIEGRHDSPRERSPRGFEMRLRLGRLFIVVTLGLTGLSLYRMIVEALRGHERDETFFVETKSVISGNIRHIEPEAVSPPPEQMPAMSARPVAPSCAAGSRELSSCTRLDVVVGQCTVRADLLHFRGADLEAYAILLRSLDPGAGRDSILDQSLTPQKFNARLMDAALKIFPSARVDVDWIVMAQNVCEIQWSIHLPAPHAFSAARPRLRIRPTAEKSEDARVDAPVHLEKLLQTRYR